MKKLLIISALFVSSFSASAQADCNGLFPTLDSLANYINRHIRNSAVNAFSELRMNTALIGMKQWMNCLKQNGVDSLHVVDASGSNPDTLKVYVNGAYAYYKLLPGGGSGSTETVTNVGSQFRLVKPLSGSNYDVKTLGNGLLINWDSATSNVLKPNVDTANFPKTVMRAGTNQTIDYSPGNPDTLTFNSTGGEGTADEGLYKTGTEFNWGVPNASSSNPLAENRRVNFNDFTMQFRGAGGNNPFINWNDPRTITNASPATTVYEAWQPLDVAGGPVYYLSQAANKPLLDAALTNHIMVRGWNLGPGLNRVSSLYTAIGESEESRYDANGSGAGYLTEKHEIFVDTSDNQIRLASYTITEDGQVDFYHTSNNFYIKRPKFPDSVWLSFNEGEFDFHGQVGGNVTLQLVDRDHPTAYLFAITQNNEDAQISTYGDFYFTSTTNGLFSVDMSFETNAATFNGFVEIIGPGGGASTGLRIKSNDATYSNLSLESDGGTMQLVHRVDGSTQFYKPGSIYYWTDNSGTLFTIAETYILQPAGTYHNWGTTTGSSGYGIRDNSGTMQFKNSAGAWTNFGSGGATPDLQAVTDEGATTTNGITINATGTSLLSFGGNTGIVAIGSSFGGEFTSGSVPLLSNNSSTSNGTRVGAIFQRTGSYTAANNDGFELQFKAPNSVASIETYAAIQALMTNVTDGAEAGSIKFNFMTGGAAAATKFTFGDTGNLTMDGSITTGPADATTVPWLLGEVITTSGLSVSTSVYVKVKINGVLYKLAVINEP